MDRSWIAVGAALVVTAATGVSSAHTRTFATGVSITDAHISDANGSYAGEIVSSRDACRVRTVAISYQTPNGKVELARGRSTSSGSFSISGVAPPSGKDVVATAKKRLLTSSSDHTHVCKAITSGSFTPESGEPGEEVPGGDVPDETLDLTALPVGDDMNSTSPQRGYLYSCQTTFNGGGASTQGPWFNGDGTWDLTKKVTVNGAVSWPHELSVTVEGGMRVFASNDLPDHPTGTFPVSTSDDAYSYDRNPNSISAQDVLFEVDATPVLKSTPECSGGTVGFMLTGSWLFNAFDAGGRDAVAWEVQDDCDGHPQSSGAYHYHSLSVCFDDTSVDHSSLAGYALDGFGIFGYRGTDGELVTNADLDACHGHTHSIAWDGSTQSMYHYHATYEFPYTVGCFRGDAIQVGTGEGGGTTPGPGGSPPPGGMPPPPGG